jgi:hypothetical protein
MERLAIVGLLVALATASRRWGRDSRPGFGNHLETLNGGLIELDSHAGYGGEAAMRGNK